MLMALALVLVVLLISLLLLNAIFWNRADGSMDGGGIEYGNDLENRNHDVGVPFWLLGSWWNGEGSDHHHSSSYWHDSDHSSGSDSSGGDYSGGDYSGGDGGCSGDGGGGDCGGGSGGD